MSPSQAQVEPQPPALWDDRASRWAAWLQKLNQFVVLHPFALGKVRSVDPVLSFDSLLLWWVSNDFLRPGFDYQDARAVRDALVTLDRIAPADALAADANRLRAEIQRDLLAAAGLASPSAAPAETRP